MRKLIVAVALASLTACATPAHKIAPVANAGPCTKADRAELAALSKKQNSAATADTIGVILIGVPVGSVGRKDLTARIAILKGRCNG